MRERLANYLCVVIEALKAITVVLQAILEMVDDWPDNFAATNGDRKRS